MKIKCDKKSVMKKAWEKKKNARFGFSRTFSQCLIFAWREEKKRVERWNDDEDRRNHTGRYSPENTAAAKARIQRVTSASMAFMADTLVEYYSRSGYHGD